MAGHEPGSRDYAREFSRGPPLVPRVSREAPWALPPPFPRPDDTLSLISRTGSPFGSYMGRSAGKYLRMHHRTRHAGMYPESGVSNLCGALVYPDDNALAAAHAYYQLSHSGSQAALAPYMMAVNRHRAAMLPTQWGEFRPGASPYPEDWPRHLRAPFDGRAARSGDYGQMNSPKGLRGSHVESPSWKANCEQTLEMGPPAARKPKDGSPAPVQQRPSSGRAARHGPTVCTISNTAHTCHACHARSLG